MRINQYRNLVYGVVAISITTLILSAWTYETPADLTIYPRTHNIFDADDFLRQAGRHEQDSSKGKCTLNKETRKKLKHLWNKPELSCELIDSPFEELVCPGGFVCNISISINALQPDVNIKAPILPKKDYLIPLRKIRGVNSDVLWLYDHVWESIVYYPEATDPKFLSQFNITIGHDGTKFDMVGIAYFNFLTLPDPYIPPDFGIVKEEVPLVWIQSNCEDKSGRLIYVKELMRFTKVHSYGKCLHNKDDPTLEGPDPDFKNIRNIMKRYHFTIAYENSISPGYISEKLWNPLAMGSIPVYLGAPNIMDYIPNRASIIDIGDFTGPEQLAKYLHRVLEDPKLYEYHKYWYKQPFTSSFKENLKLIPTSPHCVLCEATYMQDLSKLPHMVRIG